MGRAGYALCAAVLTWSGTAASQAPPAAVEAPPRSWQPADHDALEPHHLRTLAQAGSGLALGSILYWLMMDRNIADWDNPEPEERFNGRAWRLDNNSLAVNFIAHPLMGAAAYSAGRANHHGVLTSFGYSLLTSFVWEFVLEFKEKVSVNDMIVTPGTGVPLGEFFHKLGLYLDTAQHRNTALDVARWTLSPGVAMDRAFDGRPPPYVVERDSLGFSRSIWHEFSVAAALDSVTSPGRPETARGGVELQARLVTLPGYLRPGAFGRFFYQAEVSDFAAGVEASRHGAGMALRADTLLAGYHAQRLLGSDAAPVGHAGTVGISIAFDYLRSKANDYAAFREAAALPEPAFDHHVPTRAEQYSAFHLPGAALDWQVMAPGLALSVRARAHPDFAGLGAPAFYDFAAAHPEEKAKHILHRQGYFYGWGASGSLAGTLRLGPVRASGAAFYGRYWSQDGLDRHVERLTADVPVEGDVLFYSGAIGVEPPALPVTLGLRFGVRRWGSRVSEFERQGRISHRGFFLSHWF